MLLPKISDSDATWLEWLDAAYPYAPGMRGPQKRLPHQRAAVGSARELEDLRGIRDRTMAVMLAKIWVNVNKQEARALREGTEIKNTDAVDSIPPPPDYGYGNQPQKPPPTPEPLFGDWDGT